MPPDAIDSFVEDAKAILDVLNRQAQLSLQVTAADHFRKTLLLAIASHFEEQVCNSIVEFTRVRAIGSSRLESFVRNKAISRQYHTLFAWDRANANQFFGLFGTEFRNSMSATIENSEPMQAAVKAFLELGNERNKLVHQNYIVFPMDKTLDEVYELYGRAKPFVEGLLQYLLDGDAEAKDQAE